MSALNRDIGSTQKSTPTQEGRPGSPLKGDVGPREYARDDEGMPAGPGLAGDLPAEMTECLVGVGHAVGFEFLFDGITGVFVGVHNFGG